MPDEKKDYLDAYKDYASNLRSWFVGFGIGSVALLVGNKDILAFVKTGHPYLIVALLLTGSLTQILLSFINKYLNWLCYYEKKEGHFPKGSLNACIRKVFYWMHDQIWVDSLFDLATLVQFAVACGLLVHTVLKM